MRAAPNYPDDLGVKFAARMHLPDGSEPLMHSDHFTTAASPTKSANDNEQARNPWPKITPVANAPGVENGNDRPDTPDAWWRYDD